jgi:cytochrome c
MDSPLKLYSKLLGLFAIVALMVGSNFAVWGLHRQPTAPVLYVPGADSERGRSLVREYSCGACHTVPGVPGAVGEVGPRLDRMTNQIYVAGVLPNNPKNLTLWITEPKKVDPLTAMPDLGVRDADARDIAAYLYGLRRR